MQCSTESTDQQLIIFCLILAKDACYKAAETGNCQNYEARWYYDTKEERCRQFYYGGCAGKDLDAFKHFQHKKLRFYTFNIFHALVRHSQVTITISLPKNHVCSVANANSHQHHRHSSNHPMKINWNHSDPNTVCYHPRLDHAEPFNRNTFTIVAMVFAMSSVMVDVQAIKIALKRPKNVNQNVAMYKIYAVCHRFVADAKRM